ncbi:MAG: sulfurtransferase TusA family protein [Nitrososphaerota archaeon]|nr:sulfurtransferase TusA family protein [Nitrososphaerota archaeon]MDG7036237.1 sulfurtransferase TusA family protein [Nitrososphaerota archaeon]MDG7038353.1 sulfurtransferase TusA family protein [Nitrososphaerota archaeon]
MAERWQPRRKHTLDLKGYSCPYPQLLTMKKLKELSSRDVLEVVLDSPPSLTTIQGIAKRDGLRQISIEEISPHIWKVTIEKL